jgi:hypothetical protein
MAQSVGVVSNFFRDNADNIISSQTESGIYFRPDLTFKLITNSNGPGQDRDQLIR